MATLVPYTDCKLAIQLDGTDCLGDSRLTLNRNFSAIEIATCMLSSNSVTTSTQIRNLSSQTLNLSSQTLNLSSTVVSINRSFNVNNIRGATTLGTLVSSLSVYNTTGAYVGYIPIYR